MKILRIVIDTNVLVAALRSSLGASFKLLSLIDTGKFDAALTVPLMFEYEDVLQRESLGISTPGANDVLDYLCSVSSQHAVYFMWRPFLRDAKDDMVLEAAVASEASIIVTFNDKDFQGVEQFGLSVLWPADFLRLIGV